MTIATPVPRMGVDYEIYTYREMVKRTDLPRTLMGGTTEMRKAGIRYLPQEVGESNKNYDNRLQRTVLLNGFQRTVHAMTGKVFSKPIMLKEDVPEELKNDWEDIDLEGRNGDVFFKDVMEDAMVNGMSHVLVDMPSVPPGLTLADEKALGLRPYMVHVKFLNLIGWRSARINGVQTLTHVRIKEDFMADDGDFGEVAQQRIRTFNRVGNTVTWQVWVLDPKKEWKVESSGTLSLPFIPLFTYYTKRLGFMSAAPPLEDLANKNLEHWQSSSDQRHILHFARMPILFGKGLSNSDEGAIEIGPNRLIEGPPDSDLKYVEHTGAAIKAGDDDLRRIEDHMRLMGLELLMPMQGGGQTATAKSLDYADINSPLQFMAMSLGDFIERLLKAASMWRKLPTGGSVKVNTDFGITLRDAADVQTLIQARIAGEISAETFWTELKRRNILSDDFNFETEKSLLKKEKEEELEAAEAVRVPGVGDEIGAANDQQAA